MRQEDGAQENEGQEDLGERGMFFKYSCLVPLVFSAQAGVFGVGG